MLARWTLAVPLPWSKTGFRRRNNCAQASGSHPIGPDFPISLALMRYGDGLLEEIRRRTDLVQLVGRRVKLMRKGRVMWGCCPFHAEKSPSFKVENERHAYKCFGCGVGGDAFKWLIETEGLTFPEAVEKLAAEAGVELPKWY